MKRASTALALVLALLAGLASCRTAQQTRRSQAAQRPAASQTAGLASGDSLLMVEQKLVEVIDSLSSLVESDHSRIRSLEQEVSALRARMEGRMLPTSGGQTYSVQPSATSSVTGPVASQDFQPNAQPQTAAAPPTYTPPNAPVFASQAMQDRYAAALRLFNENNFTGALSAFQQLETDDPKGPYAPNYQYWEGETLYAMHRYDEALESFSDVYNNYPTSTKADDAAFKVAESYERLGKVAAAKAAYTRLITDYPKSEYRSRAVARMNGLH